VFVEVIERGDRSVDLRRELNLAGEKEGRRNVLKGMLIEV
jgi:hypothetical protein